MCPQPVIGGRRPKHRSPLRRSSRRRPAAPVRVAPPSSAAPAFSPPVPEQLAESARLDPAPAPSLAAGGRCDDPRVIEVVRLTNDSRAQNGLAPLRCDAQIGRAALRHSADQCQQGYFSHVAPDGRTPSDRIRAEGVPPASFGENIGRGQQTPAEIHRGWMNSPGHRQNILEPDYDRIGVGVASCGGRPVWTQNFAG